MGACPSLSRKLLPGKTLSLSTTKPTSHLPKSASVPVCLTAWQNKIRIQPKSAHCAGKKAGAGGRWGKWCGGRECVGRQVCVCVCGCKAKRCVYDRYVCKGHEGVGAVREEGSVWRVCVCKGLVVRILQVFSQLRRVPEIERRWMIYIMKRKVHAGCPQKSQDTHTHACLTHKSFPSSPANAWLETKLSPPSMGAFLASNATSLPLFRETASFSFALFQEGREGRNGLVVVGRVCAFRERRHSAAQTVCSTRAWA